MSHLNETAKRLLELEKLYEKRLKEGLPPSSFAEELYRIGTRNNRPDFLSSSGEKREGLWDITNDTPDPYEGRLNDYEI